MSTLSEERILDAITEVMDPELNISIVDLGLIYNIEVKENDEVNVTMTLTTVGCPLGESIAKQVEQAVLDVEGVKDAMIEVVFEPAWNINMMSDYAKDHLGLS